MMTKGDYINKLHDTFHYHPRRLEVMVQQGVVSWPFDVKKVKPVGFKKLLELCDACGIA